MAAAAPTSIHDLPSEVLCMVLSHANTGVAVFVSRRWAYIMRLMQRGGRVRVRDLSTRELCDWAHDLGWRPSRRASHTLARHGHHEAAYRAGHLYASTLDIFDRREANTDTLHLVFNGSIAGRNWDLFDDTVRTQARATRESINDMIDTSDVRFFRRWCGSRPKEAYRRINLRRAITADSPRIIDTIREVSDGMEERRFQFTMQPHLFNELMALAIRLGRFAALRSLYALQQPMMADLREVMATEVVRMDPDTAIAAIDYVYEMNRMGVDGTFLAKIVSSAPLATLGHACDVVKRHEDTWHLDHVVWTGDLARVQFLVERGWKPESWRVMLEKGMVLVDVNGDIRRDATGEPLRLLQLDVIIWIAEHVKPWDVAAQYRALEHNNRALLTWVHAKYGDKYPVPPADGPRPWPFNDTD